MPSAGLVAMAETLLCNGIYGFDYPTSRSGLEKVSNILKTNNLTPQQFLSILSNTTNDVRQLNDTLNSVPSTRFTDFIGETGWNKYMSFLANHTN